MSARMGHDFKVGELVRMKSGSSKLTVGVVERNRILCYWSDFNTGTMHSEFPPAVLVKVAGTCRECGLEWR